MDSTKQKMLKKARSFRDRIRRGTLARGLTRPESPIKVTQPQPSSTFSPPLLTSLAGGEEVQGEMSQRGSTGPVTSTVVTPAAEKLSSEYKKVHQAIKFMTYAVDKSNLVMLPGSATITLETILELIATVTAVLASQEESTLMATHLKKVYNALATLIQWADDIMLAASSSAKMVDVDHAHLVISSVHDSVKELSDLASEKAAKCSPPPPVDAAPAGNYTMATLPKGASVKKSASMTMTEKVKRNSLPEIPLTSREKTILKETSYGAFDNPLASPADAPLSASEGSGNSGDGAPEPPPKPYLPPDFELRSALTLAPACDRHTPPPLPSKQRDCPLSGDSLANGSLAGDEQQSDGALPLPTLALSQNSTRSSVSSCDDILRRGSAPRVGVAATSDRYSSGDELEDIHRGGGRIMHRLGATVRAVASLDSSHRPPPDGGDSEDAPRRRANSDYDNVEDDEGDTDSGITASGPYEFDFPTSAPPLPPTFGPAIGFARRGVADWPRGLTAMPAGNFTSIANASVSGDSRMFAASRHEWYAAHHAGATSGSSSWAYGSFVKSMSTSEVTRTDVGTVSVLGGSASVAALSGADLALHPPPLPPKKHHVESYMNVFGPYSVSQLDYSPPSAASVLQSRRFYQNVQEQHQWELFHSRFSAACGSNSLSPSPFSPGGFVAVTGPRQSEVFGHPVLPPKQFQKSSPDVEYTVPAVSPPFVSQYVTTESSLQLPVMLVTAPVSPPPTPSSLTREDSAESEPDLAAGDVAASSPLDWTDVSSLLIRERQSSNPRHSVPELKGGPVEALVVYATHVGKQDFMYEEAFLTTYRTFINPSELINKLLYRYHKFAHSADDGKRRLSRYAFSLLVRVVDELSASELTESISQLLLQLVCDLVREGELTLARILRKKVLEKVDPTQKPVDVIVHVVQLKPSKPPCLTDFSALDIAEQMTLMDKEFYERLEIAELLIWSKSQDEERCVNLVQFTAHFNKMSWWCRTHILFAEDPATREKYFLKFVKILKHLRKLNNFNSFLALLSALDSAPVRRLDWAKQATEVIKDFSVLIDSSSSFKAYRMAVSETEPPCIPYIGIILQDMTFIRLGNMPLLADGNVNFVMRWQLFNVLECLRRFRKPDYGFKKNQKVVQFLNNFDDCCTSDDDLWERSKLLKPTATR